MKLILRTSLAALAVGLLFVSPNLHAALASPESRVRQLDELVSLTADQKANALETFRMESLAVDGLRLGDGDAKTATAWFSARQSSRDAIRALLNPAQRKIYEHARQGQGGSLMRIAPEAEVARLDSLVGLTTGQRNVALQVFEEQLESLLDLPETDRPFKGMEFRQTARSQIRALLSPEQQRKYDRAPQNQGGALPVDPQNLVASLDAVVSLTAVQKVQATQIFWNEIEAQLAAATEARPMRGFMWTARIREQLRAMLAPEQQEKFGAVLPYRTPGNSAGSAPK